MDEAWQAEAEQLAAGLGVSLVGRSKGKRIVIGRDYVEEQLVVAGLSFRYRQPEGAFTQPNGEVCQKMLNWAYEALGERDDDLLELYCGNGNFTLPLATRVRRVLATEISKTSVNAALANIEDNGLDNIELVRLSAEELTQALNEVRPFRRLAGIDLKSYRFGSVFVDPPRAGMDPDTCELTRRFERILYISCNPETLAQNIAQLADTHRIERCALFDQFPTPTTWKPGCCWSAGDRRVNVGNPSTFHIRNHSAVTEVQPCWCSSRSIPTVWHRFPTWWATARPRSPR